MSRWLFVFVLASTPAVAASQTAPSDGELGGLWALETQFVSFPSGELVVERRGDRWLATFAGQTVDVEATGDRLEAAFAEGVGAFRGKRPEGDGPLEGYWRRAGASEDPRFSAGATAPFATAITLKGDGRNRWRGTVRTLPTPIRLYLKIFRNEEGMWLAALRDPDQNRIGGASRFRVTEVGGKLHFSLPNEAGGFDVAFEGVREPRTGAIRLPWPDAEHEVDLQPTTPERTRAFLPRPPGEPRYVYRVPDALDDGWPVARASEVGVDEAALTAAVREIIDGDPTAREPSLVHSMLVARRGRLILEEYFFGYMRDTPHDTRSAGKTFASVLIGAARQQGVNVGPESRIIELLADRGPFAHPDPRKAQITLTHLMTHTSGLSCNDNDEASPGQEDTMSAQRAQPDWWKYTLDLPMAHDPGTRYAYCSATMHLVSGALTAATGTWLPELFDHTLARPLGFGEWHWMLTPTGEGYLGGGAWLRPRDLLKVGQVYLDGGTWRGRRVLPESWVDESTTARIAITPQTTGYSEGEFGDYYFRGEDALAWHLGTLQVGDRSVRTYAASGNGGQILVVAPELELAMVFTGGNYRQGGIWGRWPQRFVAEAFAAGSGRAATQEAPGAAAAVEAGGAAPPTPVPAAAHEPAPPGRSEGPPTGHLDRGRLGRFGARLVVVRDPEVYRRRWGGPDVPKVESITDASLGDSLGAFVVLNGCRTDARGLCDLEADLAFHRPDGRVAAARRGQPLWKGEGSPEPNLALGRVFLELRPGPDWPHGEYRARVRIVDRNAGASLELERTFLLR
jgi:CubicO group peptidase (beta-lactamase class C family)